MLAIGINRAVDLLARKMASVRTLGPHPDGQGTRSAVRKGRFGPYVQHGKTVANLPRGVMMDDVTLDEAVALLAEKGKQLRPRGAAGRRGARGGREEAGCGGGCGGGRGDTCRAGQAEGQAGKAARGKTQTRGAEAGREAGGGSQADRQEASGGARQEGGRPCSATAANGAIRPKPALTRPGVAATASRQ